MLKHPDFDPRRPMNYDIALLKLDGTSIFNGLLPEVLYEVDLPILNTNEGSRALSTLKKSIQGDAIMCAGFPDEGEDACQGGSGGPFFIHDINSVPGLLLV